MTSRGYSAGGLLAALALVAACGGSGEADSESTLTLYTCVSDTTIEPVIEQFEQDNPGISVDLFRAPTGDLNARVASDVRSGGLQADVIWACDPLTMQDYVDQGIVGGWTPDSDVPANLRTGDYVGVAILYMVTVSNNDVEPPRAWSDLTGEEYAGGVAVPDPAFAASALGALGYFAQDPDYGIEFYADLEENGAEQVSTPDDVVIGVAEGVYPAGITIANSAYAAQEGGSPIETVWPEPGAIAIYGPAALSTDAADSKPAKDFLSYIAGEDGQRLIADSGSYPAQDGVPGPTMPADAPIVFPDWASVAAEKDQLLEEHQQIFGG